MKTIFNILSNFATKRSLNLNHNILRSALLVLLATFSITNAWGNSYSSEFTAKSGNSAQGLVYAANSDTEGAIEQWKRVKTIGNGSDKLDEKIEQNFSCCLDGCIGYGASNCQCSVFVTVY